MKKWDFWLISIILLLFIISLPLLGINIGLCVKQFDMNGDAKCQIDDNILYFNPIQTWGVGEAIVPALTLDLYNFFHKQA